jgi:hypothetical protein
MGKVSEVRLLTLGDRFLVSAWCKVGEERVSSMYLRLSEQLGMTLCIMREARVGRSRDKEKYHLKDITKIQPVCILLAS